MAVLQDININVHGQPSEKRLQTFLRLSQNENGRLISFRVLGPPLPSGCTATFAGTKPDGNVYSTNGTVTGNFVVVQEDIQMTAVAGVWDAKLDIVNGTHNIMTALIRVTVERDVVDPDAIASDSQLQGLVAEAKYYAEHARTDAYGSPLTAPTKAQMTDHTRVYVYTGSEPNMVAGNWYHWNGTAWISGGVYNAVAVQTDTTLRVAGKAADAEAVGDEIAGLKEDLNAVSDESIVSFETINITKDVAFVPGKLNNTNGNVQSNADYQTSDFIPIDGNIVYVLKNVARYCAYDESKEYPSAVYGDNKQTAVFGGRSYLRVSILNSNIDDVFICEGEKYYPNEAEADSQPQNINAMGNNFVPKMLSEIANTDDNHFSTGKNLFDVNGGYIYVLGQAQIAISHNTGAVDVNATRFQQNLDRKCNGADIPANGCIASTYFIPVQAGKYMFVNYGYWASAAYDSSKNYVQSVPVCPYAFTGYLIPEGVSYVRLNFKAQTVQNDNALQSVEDAKNIIVWQEDEAVCTHPATTLQKQIDGSFVSPNYLDKVVPNMIDSDFLSAMKCMTVREINRREHAWRFGNFNAYVGSGTKGYYLIRKMLMDNGVDFCGFEEMGNRATDIGTYLKSWQFADGFVSPKNDSGNGTNALSIVSRFEVQTWNTYTMTTVSGNKDCINARIRLPRYMDVYNPFRILSMYVIHPMVGANQQNLANELLSIIANDNSDYIVITSDTNSFGDTEESKVFWRVLEAGGFRPTIPITTKTVTQDNLSSESDTYPEKPWRHHSIDQIFISSNIDCVSYNVINTKDEYIGFYKNNTTTDGEYALSDHDFVYADLVFKDEARQ